MPTTQPIRDPAQVAALLAHYRTQGHYRNNLLIAIGIHTALRISDILRISSDMVYDFKNHQIRESITIIEKKTRKSKTIALNKHVISALKLYFPEAHQNAPLILNPNTGKAITRMHANRIVDDAAKAVGIPFKVSCHSLRKTFGYRAWKIGVSPTLIMDIYNHNSYTATKRYLGVSQDDQNTVYNDMTF